MGVCVWRSLLYGSVDLSAHEVYLGLRFSHIQQSAKNQTLEELSLFVKAKVLILIEQLTVLIEFLISLTKAQTDLLLQVAGEMDHAA